MKLIIRLIFILVTLFSINITAYAYTEYKVGDVVTYNEIEFYVIKDSSSNETSVTMLKAEPLTVDEVNTYGVGHVNRYTDHSVGTVYNQNGYGGLAYYTSETCGCMNNRCEETECTTNYVQSEIKYVVDAWKVVKAPEASEARLIILNDLEELGYELRANNDTDSSLVYKKTDKTPSWLYNSNYYYWTASSYQDMTTIVWFVGSDGVLNYSRVDYNGGLVIRPVITLSKTVLGDNDESLIDGKEEIKDSEETSKSGQIGIVDKNNENRKVVKVENTYMNSSVTIIFIGLIVSVLSIVLFYKFFNKKGEI